MKKFRQLIWFFIITNISSMVWAQDVQVKTLPPIVNFLLDEQPGSFSGTISLPSGLIAGPDGVTFEIKSNPIQLEFIDGQFLSSSTEVTIPNGQNSVSFQFDLLRIDNLFGPFLEFECLTGCTALDITSTGIWSESLGVTGSILSSATTYSDSRDNAVDLLMEDADTFSGVVSLPDGYENVEEFSIIVRISDSGFFQFDSYSTFVQFESGDTSMPFSIGVPSDESSSWTISVNCVPACPSGIVNETVYATEFVGDPLTENQNLQRLFPVASDYPNLTLTLLQLIE